MTSTTTTARLIQRLAALALGVTLTWSAGCEKGEDQPSPPPQPPPPTAPNPAPPPPDVTPKAQASGTKQPATLPLTTVTPDPDNPIGGGVVPPRESGEASGEQVKQAQALLAEATTALKDNRPGDARAALDRVKAMESTLPNEVREMHKTTRAALEKVETLQSGATTADAGDEENK